MSKYLLRKMIWRIDNRIYHHMCVFVCVSECIGDRFAMFFLYFIQASFLWISHRNNVAKRVLQASLNYWNEICCIKLQSHFDVWTANASVNKSVSIVSPLPLLFLFFFLMEASDKRNRVIGIGFYWVIWFE